MSNHANPHGPQCDGCIMVGLLADRDEARAVLGAVAALVDDAKRRNSFGHATVYVTEIDAILAPVSGAVAKPGVSRESLHRSITKAWMVHLGYEAGEVDAMPDTTEHVVFGCEATPNGYDCIGEDGESRHPMSDEADQTAEFVGFVLDRLEKVRGAVSGPCAWCDSLATGTARAGIDDQRHPSCGQDGHGLADTYTPAVAKHEQEVRADDDTTVRLTHQEFDALMDYSSSLPTGTTIGKRWKRRNDYYDESKGWRLGEYVEHDNPDLVGLRWRDIEIVAARADALTGGPTS